MKRLRRLIIGLLGALVIAAPARAAVEASVSGPDWAAYVARFLDPSGRIIDTGNGGISHSEGQGYGLLLAVLAGDRANFERIWSFTRSELMLRDDGLAVWKWDPASKPHVTDPNNATDGDILIAYALARAGKAWKRPDLTRSAQSLAHAIASSATMSVGDARVIAPGAAGFGPADRADGPVVNLSYWVFEAFPVLSELAPETDWGAVSGSGLALLRSVAGAPDRLPPDWVSIRTTPRAADGFPAEFGYNAIRIPLYLMRAGVRDRAVLEPFRAGMTASGGAVRTVSTPTGETRETLADPGYRIIPALIACVLDGTRLSPEIAGFVPTDYYPSTLHLLALAFATSRHPECL